MVLNVFFSLLNEAAKSLYYNLARINFAKINLVRLPKYLYLHIILY